MVLIKSTMVWSFLYYIRELLQRRIIAISGFVDADAAGGAWLLNLPPPRHVAEWNNLHTVWMNVSFVCHTAHQHFALALLQHRTITTAPHLHNHFSLLYCHHPTWIAIVADWGKIQLQPPTHASSRNTHYFISAQGFLETILAPCVHELSI